MNSVISQCTARGEAGFKVLFRCEKDNLLLVLWETRGTATEAIGVHLRELDGSFEDLGSEEFSGTVPGVIMHRLRSRPDGTAAPATGYEGFLASRTVSRPITRTILCAALGNKQDPRKCAKYLDELLADKSPDFKGLFAIWPDVLLHNKTLSVPNGCRPIDYNDGTRAIACGIERLEITSVAFDPKQDSQKFVDAFVAAQEAVKDTEYAFVAKRTQCVVGGVPVSDCFTFSRTKPGIRIADRGMWAVLPTENRAYVVNCLYVRDALPPVCQLAFSLQGQ